MKILILGAAGQIAQRVTETLLKHTDANLILYAREASKRLHPKDKNREQVIDGDFENFTQLEKAMDGVDCVFIDSVESKKGMQTIVKAMKAKGVKKLIAATSLGIYDELDYTLMRMAWLYDDDKNTKYELTEKGEPFKGTQVTREAIAQLVLEIVQSKDKRFAKKSLGVSEPKTVLLVSSVGADVKSSVFYTRMKGETERDIINLGLEHTYIFRPSMILGDRKEKRPLELFIKGIWRVINPLFVGRINRYKGIEARDIARAMVNAANGQEVKERVRVLHWGEMSLS